MSGGDLEARYDRLLRWYPAEHRSVHRDEMLGVLMAAARPGREWPGVHESADLLLGAALIRVRPGSALSDRSGWRDALAMYSVAAPVLMMCSAALAWIAAAAWSSLGQTGGVFLNLGYNGAFNNVSGAHPLIGTLLWLMLAGQGIVAALALVGFQRCAAAAAALHAAYFGIYAGISWSYSTGFGRLNLFVPLLFVAPLTTLVALLVSDGPRRGRQLLRRRHWVYLALSAVPGAALMNRAGLVGTEISEKSPWIADLLMAAAIGALLLVLLAAWLSSAQGKRMAVLFGVLAFPVLLQLVEDYFTGSWPFRPGSATELDVLVPTCEAGIVGLLALVIYRTRRGAKSPGGGPGSTPAG